VYGYPGLIFAYSKPNASNWHSEVLKDHTFNYTDDVEAFDRMMRGKSAFLTTQDVYRSVYQSRRIPDKDMCALVSNVPFSKRTMQSGFFLPKGTPFKESLNSRHVRWSKP
jgi:hypothetical protein